MERRIISKHTGPFSKNLLSKIYNKILWNEFEFYGNNVNGFWEIGSIGTYKTENSITTNNTKKHIPKLTKNLKEFVIYGEKQKSYFSRNERNEIIFNYSDDLGESSIHIKDLTKFLIDKYDSGMTFDECSNILLESYTLVKPRKPRKFEDDILNHYDKEDIELYNKLNLRYSNGLSLWKADYHEIFKCVCDLLGYVNFATK